jgi:hypothetical protein
MHKARFGVRRLVPVVIVIASIISALVAASARANSQAATISFVGTATLVSDPGPVIVTLHYSCLPGLPLGGPGFIEVNLDESGIPGGAFDDANCDGRNHSVTVTVDGAFVPGTAAGRATVTNNSGGALATTNQTVSIK